MYIRINKVNKETEIKCMVELKSVDENENVEFRNNENNVIKHMKI